MPPEASAEIPLWQWIPPVAISILALVVSVALLLNVHKLLSRLSAIRREIEQSRQAGAGPHLAEAVAQLQSAAVSLDRIAARADTIDRKLDAIAERGPGGGQTDLSEAVTAIREGLAALGRPVAEIRDLLDRTESEKLADEVRRAIFTRGYDKVVIATDLTSVPKAGETRVLVEVFKEGVRSKGFVLLRDGSAAEVKISALHDMFP